MRTKTEIINELNQVQNLCNRLVMEIGQGYARIKLKNDESIIASVNQKIDAYSKAESQMRFLEQELANTRE